MNELLLWMSAKRFGSEQSFRAKALELDAGQARTALARYRLAEWNLSKLGHAEFGLTADGAGWRIAPPVLAADDFQGPWRAILCGARTSKLVQRLTEVAGTDHLSIRQQPDGPDVIELTSESAPTLAEVAVKAGIRVQWNASLALLAACTPPKDVTLQPAELPVGGWEVSRFSKSHLAWVPSAAGEAAKVISGLFRFRADYRTTYILVEGSRPWTCSVSEAKFRILRRQNRALSYDHTAQEIAVAISCRPPLLVERALVLCSGELPTLRDGHLIYSRVRRSVAAAVAALLAQRLT